MNFDHVSENVLSTISFLLVYTHLDLIVKVFFVIRVKQVCNAVV